MEINSKEENKAENKKPDNTKSTILIMIINVSRLNVPSKRLRLALKKINPDNKK